MKFFELHFNPPRAKGFLKRGEAPDLVFDTFYYEPQNATERRLGYLFVAGELRNVMPSDLKLLDNLALHLKASYYSRPGASPELAIKTALRKANEFLEETAKGGQVSWLGNLNLGVCAVSQLKREIFLANFAKVDEIKIMLLRPGQVLDVGKNLDFSGIEPYPLKIFGNLVSGKLQENDIVAILTKEVFELFSSQGVLKDMAKVAEFWSEKKFREVLKSREKTFPKVSGVCLFCVLTKDEWTKAKEPNVSLTFQKKPEKFSLKKAIILAFTSYPKKLAFLIGKIRRRPKKEKRGKSLGKLPARIAALWQSFALLRDKARALWVKKNIILLLLLAFILLVGFLLFK
ncbi:MAG: hypothetical protein G01um101430_243 [Parcubacteria group bacterium Gr01-1014_30]|nr:MAG: hypothetical protein G01um101430_243 [Parcubacteria group bacterium Gr01-1014_30]